MRSFFVNQLDREGFKKKSYALVPNTMKFKAIENFKKSDNGKLMTTRIEKMGGGFKIIEVDSNQFYRSYLHEKDSVFRGIIPADSVGYQVNPTTAGF